LNIEKNISNLWADVHLIKFVRSSLQITDHLMQLFGEFPEKKIVVKVVYKKNPFILFFAVNSALARKRYFLLATVKR